MALKMTGAEAAQFYADPAYWGGETWHEQESVEFEGKVAAEDADLQHLFEAHPAGVFRISDGCVWVNGRVECSFEAYARRWRRAQATVTVAVSVPRERLEELRAAVAALGGGLAA